MKMRSQPIFTDPTLKQTRVSAWLLNATFGLASIDTFSNIIVAVSSAGLKGGGGLGARAPPPPEEAVSVLKYKNFHALCDIASIYTVMHTYMITEYLHNNSAERKGGQGGTDRAVSVTRACK